MFRSPFAALALAALISAGAGVITPAHAEDVRLGHDVVPVFQSVELKLDSGTPDYTGSTVVDLKVNNRTDTFRFHAEAMDLQSLVLKQGDAVVGLTHESGDRGVITCTTERPLEPGDYTLEIVFTDDFNTDAVGLYRMEKDGIGYAFTQFQADDGREAFPMWDEPIFKIPFQLTLSVPEDHMAVTNTPPLSETVATDGEPRSSETKPLPSYLLAIATGPLEAVDIPDLGVPGRVITVQGQSHLTELAIQVTPPLLKVLEEYFGSSYPYRKVRPDRHSRVLGGGDGEPGSHHLPGSDPPSRFGDRHHQPEAAPGSGYRPRAGPHVVRRRRHHGVVGRSVAQRILRRLDGRQGGRPGFPREQARSLHHPGRAASHARRRSPVLGGHPPARTLHRQPHGERGAGLQQRKDRPRHDRAVGR